MCLTRWNLSAIHFSDFKSLSFIAMQFKIMSVKRGFKPSSKHISTFTLNVVLLAALIVKEQRGTVVKRSLTLVPTAKGTTPVRFPVEQKKMFPSLLTPLLHLTCGAGAAENKDLVVSSEKTRPLYYRLQENEQ